MMSMTEANALRILELRALPARAVAISGASEAGSRGLGA